MKFNRVNMIHRDRGMAHRLRTANRLIYQAHRVLLPNFEL
jgi:hypothetical protein